ncbi:hypothetical protein [Nostoc sp. FACHB-888]|uniref:hypothetical protein n=1 Tax=Nostoc sp. FACHB-888 TaxID=2692842 RepID=UPI00168695EE|nr:hypothetical protein [Nostoc sp. FACHB-888]MBD2246727.1 hypothetical protein [Nostoc sp. FACHB-888]
MEFCIDWSNLYDSSLPSLGIHNLFLTSTGEINHRHRRHHRRDVCTHGHRHHRRDLCTHAHRHHRRDLCTHAHHHHRRDLCTHGHRHHRRDVCTGDRDYPTLHHLVSACHRLYF